MEVKPGYKQTEVGVIPEEWEVARIADVADVKTGPFGSALHERDYVHDGTPIITVEHLGEFGVMTINLPLVSDADRHRLRAYSLDVGDIVFSRVGSVDRNALIRETEAGWLFSGGLLRVRPSKNRAYSPYLSYQFHGESFKRRVRDVAVGQTMASLNTKILNNVKVVLPIPSEQRAIAGVLSDMDALIGVLDRLISKKRDLKQAAMQQLLIGQTRLPGFHGEWEVKPLGDLAEIVMGQSPSSSHYNNKSDGLPLIQGNADIANRKTVKRVFTTEITRHGRCGDILMSVRAPVGEISRAVFDICLGRGVCAIRFPNNYLYHALIAKEPTWAKLSKGSTFDSVTSSDVKAFEIELPTDKKEQTAIAEVLSDMDAELAALTQRRDKTRALKQGMMQELLTGRIRLV
jgi:type I restriction enzyme S subunit